jgi:CheY-like chemotaxis protein
VYGVVKQSGGTIAIDTKLGSGTTVTVYLPRAGEQPSLHAGDRSNEIPLPRHDATILVVDDDPDVRQLVVSCLESLGYHIRSAADGRAALDMLAENTPIDLLLIDVAMPEINGIETVRAMLRKRPNLPFLYMTGYVGRAHLDEGERRVLKKPFTVAELSSKVEEILFPAEARRLPPNVFPIKPGNLAS